MGGEIFPERRAELFWEAGITGAYRMQQLDECEVGAPDRALEIQCRARLVGAITEQRCAQVGKCVPAEIIACEHAFGGEVPETRSSVSWSTPAVRASSAAVRYPCVMWSAMRSVAITRTDMGVARSAIFRSSRLGSLLSVITSSTCSARRQSLRRSGSGAAAERDCPRVVRSVLR